MAGTPKKRAAFEALEHTGIDAICSMLAEGGSLRSIAGDLGVSATALYFYLRQDQHRMAYREAQRARAQRLADEALQAADEATPTTAQVAKLRVDTRRWLAGLLDRESFGEKAPPEIQLNVAQLHIAALRQHALEEKNRRNEPGGAGDTGH